MWDYRTILFNTYFVSLRPGSMSGGWGCGGYISLNESTILNYHRSTVAGFKLIVEHIRDYCGWETTLIVAA